MLRPPFIELERFASVPVHHDSVLISEALPCLPSVDTARQNVYFCIMITNFFTVLKVSTNLQNVML